MKLKQRYSDQLQAVVLCGFVKIYGSVVFMELLVSYKAVLQNSLKQTGQGAMTAYPCEYDVNIRTYAFSNK
jgi:hypothetical protein